METYLNPGNQGFSGIRNDIYVDKSGLIGLINDTINTPRRLTCISRLRSPAKAEAFCWLVSLMKRIHKIINTGIHAS